MRYASTTFLVCFLAVCLLTGAAVPQAAAEEAPAQVLRHMVLLKFKDDATAAQIRDIETAFCRLPSATGVIYGME